MFNRILSKLILGVYRYGHFVHYHVRVPIIRHSLVFFYLLLDTLIVRILAQAEIPRRARIGSRLDLRHGGNGIIINPDAIIGSDVMIYQQVTIGTLGGTENYGEAPVIGDRVMIGAGAKVLGPIIVGNDVKIGANAVVVSDVPSGATVVGVPARVVKSRKNEIHGGCSINV